MMSMSRLLKSLIFGAFVALTMSCSSEQKTTVDFTVTDAASSEIVVKRLDMKGLTVVDTLALDASGKVSCNLDVKAGDPDIMYVFYKGKKIASMIVRNQDVLTVVADTLGNFSVKGSDEAEKFAQVEKDYAVASSKMNALSAKIASETDAAKLKALNEELTKEYIAYYRQMVKYIMENPTSLSVVPVVYQSFGEGLPVFGQKTDAIHIDNLSKSLIKAYPDSRYARALVNEAEMRMEYLQLQTKLDMAEEIGFPSVVLPDVTGVNRSLSGLKKKAVLVHFWTPQNVAQKMFNLETLLPIYKEFAGKGFEIYQVALEVDKGYWAQIVKSQALPWISVCDNRAASSPYLAAYNVQQLPAMYLLGPDGLVDVKITDGASLRKALRKLL